MLIRFVLTGLLQSDQREGLKHPWRLMFSPKDCISSLMPGPLTADDRHARERAEAMYMMGIPSLDIAAQLGLKRERVRQWVVRGDWFNRKKVQQANQSQILNKALVNHVTDAVLGHKRKISKLVDSNLDNLATLGVTNTKSASELATALKTLDDVGRRNLGMDSESEQSKRSNTFNFNLRAMQVQPVVEVESQPISDNTSQKEHDDGMHES